MTIFESILINTIFILFPLSCYFLFVINQKVGGKKIDDIFFDLAIYTSLYLILRYDTSLLGIKITLISIPLFISYFKNRMITSIFISIIISIYYWSIMSISFSLIILEFIIYFLISYLFNNKKRNLFYLFNILIFIKIIFLSFYLNDLNEASVINISNIIYYLFLVLIFYFLIYFIYLLLEKCEQITNLHVMIKELEKEKQLRDSLFKITHEIKNPIAVCKGYLDMLDIDNKKHIKTYIPIIKQEIQRTLMIMNDFLNLTKLKVERTKLDISVLLEDVCDMAKTLVRARNMTFICSILDDEIYLLGDYDRLKQVFINLIKNAIESIKEGTAGVIKIKARRETKKNIIKIYISDNGIGMDEELLVRIGEPFYSTKKEGTGLGVRFSKEIIKAHDGEIIYKSKKGKGTTVIIILPLIKKSP